MNEEVKKIMRKCWQENPDSRPNIEFVRHSLESIKSNC